MKFLAIACLLFCITNRFIAQKSRLIVTTDKGQDIDDRQSMMRLWHLVNEFELTDRGQPPLTSYRRIIIEIK